MSLMKTLCRESSRKEMSRMLVSSQDAKCGRDTYRGDSHRLVETDFQSEPSSKSLAYQALSMSQFQRRLYSYSLFGFISLWHAKTKAYTQRSAQISTLFFR